MKSDEKDKETCNDIPATKLIHLSYEGNFELNCNANILHSRCIVDKEEEKEAKNDNEGIKVELQLDITTMHPQGGGQPSDIGTITTPSFSIHIDRVMLDRSTGIITHFGTIPTATFEQYNSAGDMFPVGTKVQVSVDPNHRQIHSECHTAGHVIDSAMERCGLDLQATKGYHFLDSPYVEYKGKLPTDKSKEDIISSLNEAFQQIISEDLQTTIQTLTKSEADTLCNRLAQNFDFTIYDDDDEIRVVTVGGLPCPCGGTHVRSTSDLKERGWVVLGIRAKRGVIRVKYGFSK